MNVQVELVQRFDVCLSEDQQLEAAVSYVNRVFDLKGGDYINKKNELCYEADRHPREYEVVIRKATKEDQDALLLIKKFQEYREGLRKK